MYEMEYSVTNVLQPVPSRKCHYYIFDEENTEESLVFFTFTIKLWGAPIGNGLIHMYME